MGDRKARRFHTYAFGAERRGVLECLSNVNLPLGRRFALEPVYHILTPSDPIAEKNQTLVGWRSYIIVDPPAFDEHAFLGVRVSEDGDIELALNGGSSFASFTRAHIGKRVAFVISGDILTAPVVHAAIEGRTMMSPPV